MKSRRKSKKTLTIKLSAGDREHVATHCPYDMTEIVKLALEEEIKNFDASSARQAAEISSSGRSIDAYQDWVDTHDGHEPCEANPDMIADENGFKYIPFEKDEEVSRLLSIFRKFLPLRQRQVWNLVMHHQMSLRDTAKLLGISKGSVQEHLNTARKKFHLFMESERDV